MQPIRWRPARWATTDWMTSSAITACPRPSHAASMCCKSLRSAHRPHKAPICQVAEAKRELTGLVLSAPGKELTAASFCRPPYSARQRHQTDRSAPGTSLRLVMNVRAARGAHRIARDKPRHTQAERASQLYTCWRLTRLRTSASIVAAKGCRLCGDGTRVASSVVRRGHLSHFYRPLLCASACPLEAS